MSLRKHHRPALAALAAAAVAVPLGMAGAAPATAAPAPAVVAPSAMAALEAEVFEQINAYRVQQGVAPLARSASIDEVARSWSENQAAQGRMFHNPSYGDQMPAGARAWAENVAYLNGYSVEQMAEVFVDGWINSDGHRRNILDADMTHTGVGIAQNADGDVYATQNFGSYPGGLADAQAPAPAQEKRAPAPAPAPAPAEDGPAEKPAPASEEPAPAPAEEPAAAPAEEPAAAPAEEPAAAPAEEPAAAPAEDPAEEPAPAPEEPAEAEETATAAPEKERQEPVAVSGFNSLQRWIVDLLLSVFGR
ncbi:CAP domain-containing protein [Georgenia sp. AZ-5]|uniref:CAP domain-containing protein n=1 Tax=Georgenia sp. AZ-5 TaxID=3367526 RepID=UPI003754C738